MVNNFSVLLLWDMGYVSIISLDNSKKANLIYKMCGNNSRWTKRRNHSGIKLDLSIPYMVYSIPSKPILKVRTISSVYLKISSYINIDTNMQIIDTSK